MREGICSFSCSCFPLLAPRVCGRFTSSSLTFCTRAAETQPGSSTPGAKPRQRRAPKPTCHPWLEPHGRGRRELTGAWPSRTSPGRAQAVLGPPHAVPPTLGAPMSCRCITQRGSQAAGKDAPPHHTKGPLRLRSSNPGSSVINEVQEQDD